MEKPPLAMLTIIRLNAYQSKMPDRILSAEAFILLLRA